MKHEGAVRLEIVPCDLDEANAFVSAHHRTHKKVRGQKFSVAVAATGAVVGVAISGKPRARNLNDGWTLEVYRNCTDGTKNACSALYMASWRTARNMGYRRMVTYIGVDEPGTSLKAAGWKLVAEVKGASWDRGARPRVDKHPTQDKLRWETIVTMKERG